MGDLKDDLIEEYSKEKPDLSAIETTQDEIEKITNSGDINNLFSDGWGSNEDADNEQRDFLGKRFLVTPNPLS